MAKKSKQELEYQLKGKRIDRTADVLGQVIRYGSLAGCVYFATMVLRAFASQHTMADVGIGVIGNLHISDALFTALAGAGPSPDTRNGNFDGTQIEELGPKQKEREERIDPHRSSSKLTPRGTTRLEDRKR